MSMTSARDVVPGTMEAGGHAEQGFRELRADYRRSIRRVTWPILAVALMKVTNRENPSGVR